MAGFVDNDREGMGDLGRVTLYIFLFSWFFILIDAILIAMGLRDDFTFGLLAQFGPSIVGIWYISRKYGKEGRQRFMARANLLRNAPAWLTALIVLFLPMLSLGVGYLIVRSGRIPDPTFPFYPADVGLFTIEENQWYLAFPVTLLLGLIFGGISEEFGFRGYVLPMLQRRWNALTASVMMALIWTVWHLEPTILATLFTDGFLQFIQELIPYYLYFFITTLPLTILMTWAFNHSKGSIWIAILFHGVNNGVGGVVQAVFGTGADFPRLLENGFAVMLWVLALIVLAVYGIENLNKKEPRSTELFWEKP